MKKTLILLSDPEECKMLENESPPRECHKGKLSVSLCNEKEGTVSSHPREFYKMEPQHKGKAHLKDLL